MWDTGPQSIESSKPQNQGSFLLQISLHSLGSFDAHSQLTVLRSSFSTELIRNANHFIARCGLNNIIIKKIKKEPHRRFWSKSQGSDMTLAQHPSETISLSLSVIQTVPLLFQTHET